VSSGALSSYVTMHHKGAGWVGGQGPSALLANPSAPAAISATTSVHAV
jgi:hypothetical protein